MSPQRHVILRQTVELVLANDKDTWSLQQEASRILRKTQPLIERCCDALSSPGRLHRIECLELDLGTLDLRRLEAELLVKFGQTLHQALSEQISRQESGALSPATASQLELFAQFIRQGSLPWWADLSQTNLLQESLDQLLRDAPDLLRWLLPQLAGDQRTLQRLAGYLDERRLAALVFLNAPTLTDFPLALFEALLFLPEYLPTLGATPPARFRNRLWQCILGNAVLSIQLPANPLDFSRDVMIRLARLQAVPYPTLVQGFAEAAVAGRFQGVTQDIAAALETECQSGTTPVMMKHQAESAHEVPHSRLWNSVTGAAALTELRHWLVRGVLEPAPSWLGTWPQALREALFTHLGEMGGNLEEGLAALRGWLEHGLQKPMPLWLQEWPPLLREEFAAQLQEVGKRLDGDLRPTLTDDVLAKQWQQIDFSDADVIYLGNAGLVILWPFLQTLFKRLDLLKDNDFIDAATRQRGAALLQCLASEEVESPEYLLPLNKVLCGMALASVFELDKPLSEKEIIECNALLKAVIAQAPILNDMSIQGFRSSFLLRTGILEVRDGAWLLRVERETYDLVLERFPWSFEWVKLPWMESPLQVEW